MIWQKVGGSDKAVTVAILTANSSKNFTGTQVKDFQSVQEELCSRKRRPLSGLEDCIVDPEPNCSGRGE